MEQPIPQEKLEGSVFAGLTVYSIDKDKKAPKGAVCKTATQYLDKDGQPLAPPVDLLGE
jgi:hypothetical protein